jgi:small conductance mechanosensitive channel
VIKKSKLNNDKIHAWERVGLRDELTPKSTARRAWFEGTIYTAIIAGLLISYNHRAELIEQPNHPAVRLSLVLLVVIVGWALARAVGQAVAPALMKRVDPATAGSLSFLFRLMTMILALAVALRYAGIKPETLALGGVFTAVVLGLAAQQTFANLFAGVVMMTTRPFRVGDRIRLQGGMLAGTTEGTVANLGLFYTTLVNKSNQILIPNRITVDLIVIPIREPERVEVRARFDRLISPAVIEGRLTEMIETPMRYSPHVELEEVDKAGVVMDITATPHDSSEGGTLAAEIITAVEIMARDTGEHKLN